MSNLERFVLAGINALAVAILVLVGEVIPEGTKAETAAAVVGAVNLVAILVRKLFPAPAPAPEPPVDEAPASE